MIVEALRRIARERRVLWLAIAVASLTAIGVHALYGHHEFSRRHWLATMILSTLGTLGIHLGRALALCAFGNASTDPVERMRRAIALVPRLISLLLIELVIVISLVGGGYIVTLPLYFLHYGRLAIALCLTPPLAIVLITFVVMRLAYALVARTRSPSEAVVLACDVVFRRPGAATGAVLVTLCSALPFWLVAVGAWRLGATSLALVLASAGLLVSYGPLSVFVGRDPRLGSG